MTAAARGSRSAPYRRAPPRRPGPSPHTGWSTAPHRGWRRHPARRRHPAWWGTYRWSQHSRDGDFLTVNLTSAHVLQSLLSLLRGLKLHVRVALGQMWVDTTHGHVNHLDLAVRGENLLDVLLDDISGQAAQVNFGRFGCGAPTPAVSVIPLC